ncbi:hypothetical protein ANCDUO_00169 [Ancylostoma duodenale]|uniref:Uncharacterized protein n=1 Tax=Ancylostoma duodenale TaxID=51022 RepID=A0A0C2HCR3_9BILA|nr:hypothetical protein ANCDUO_00169 [Ancylostoma duodenale]
MCPTCCAAPPPPPPVVDVAVPCCAARPQAPMPLPPPPPAPSTVQCCKAAPVPLNPCCQHVHSAAFRPQHQPIRAVKRPYHQRVCAKCHVQCHVGVLLHPPKWNATAACFHHQGMCAPMAISCRLSFRVRRDAQSQLLSHLARS